VGLFWQYLHVKGSILNKINILCSPQDIQESKTNRTHEADGAIRKAILHGCEVTLCSCWRQLERCLCLSGKKAKLELMSNS